MSLYPTYYPQANNGYNQQMVNPYMDRINFLQSYQQGLQQQPVAPTQMPVTNQQIQPMQTGLNGRIVQNADMITVNDVPMDCTAAIFPKQDLSEIYVKYWDNNGIIRTIVFKPLLEQNPNNLSSNEEKSKFDDLGEFKDIFTKRFDSLENRINELLTKSIPKPVISKSKKESDTE